MKTTLAVLTIGTVALAACPAAATAAYWTGFYAGAEIGKQESDTDWRTTGFETPVAPADLDPSTANRTFKTSTLNLGGFAGYDYRVNPYLVLGAEANIATHFGAERSAGIPGNIFYPPGVAPADTLKYKTKYDVALLMRVGIPVRPDTLLFVMGGLALTEREFKLSCYTGDDGWCLPPDTRAETFSKVLTGWTVGAGFESRITQHWAARFTYRYADYGEDKHSFLAALAGDSIHANLSTVTHAFNIGLVYRF